MIYRPIRPRKLDFLKQRAIEMLDNTGYEEITLSSLSSSDYDELADLVYYLIEECRQRKLNIALPSLRIDAFSLDVMSKVQDIRKSSLTFAPEAGSQRMRDVINKGLTKDVILKGAWEAFQGGWKRVKLYFMLGLPGETDEDIAAIAELANDIAATYFELPKEERQGRPEITASTSFFVPKPFTPFQWAPMGTAEYFDEKRRFLTGKVREQINQRSIRYICHDAVTSELEGIFARGDRWLSDVIEKAYQKGCIFEHGPIIFDRMCGMNFWTNVVLTEIFIIIENETKTKSFHGILLILVSANSFYAVNMKMQSREKLRQIVNKNAAAVERLRSMPAFV